MSVLLNIRFHDLDASLCVAYIMLAACFLGVTSVRILYLSMDWGDTSKSSSSSGDGTTAAETKVPLIGPAAAEYAGNKELILAVNGFRYMRWAALMLAIVLCLLGFRVPYTSVSSSSSFSSSSGSSSSSSSAYSASSGYEFLSLDAITHSWWCLLRIALGCMSAQSAYLFDSHAAFRWWMLGCLPCLALLDMLSFEALSSRLWCLDQDVCIKASDNEYTNLTLMAWRDIISAALSLTVLMVAAWLTALFGVTENEVYMPRKEHRQLTMWLDATKKKWQRKKKIERVRGAAIEMRAY